MQAIHVTKLAAKKLPSCQKWASPHLHPRCSTWQCMHHGRPLCACLLGFPMDHLQQTLEDADI